MQERWVLKQRPGNYAQDGARLGVDPIVLRVLYNRNVCEDEAIRQFYNVSLDQIYFYEGLPNLSEAAELLMYHFGNASNIRIIGDYDVDGIMSTITLVRGLKAVNSPCIIDYDIPDRIQDGYGLNQRLIDKAIADGIDCIITCDNGISASDQITYALEHGVEVIVTDHHEPQYHMEGDEKVYTLPPCICIDPKMTDSTYSFSEICGAVVAFKFLVNLYDQIGIDRDPLDELIQYIAFATVTDIMPLTNENRSLVIEGLKRLTTTSNLGLQCLKEYCELRNKPITYYHVGFILGPCLNAAGRLNSATTAVDLLTTSNLEVANNLAAALRDLNVSRKRMTEDNVSQALEVVKDDSSKVLMVLLKDCHESITGIVAGHVKDAVYKPTLICTKTEDGIIKGSGRSIETYDMFAEMNSIKHLFLKFGGHKMASGFSFEESKFQEIKDTLNSQCTLTETDLTPKVTIDMELPFRFISISLINKLSQLAPFGTSNPKPLFLAKDVLCDKLRLVGRNHNICQVKCTDDTYVELSAVCFDNAIEFYNLAQWHKRLHICFSLDINEWKGNKYIQLIIQHFKLPK